MALDHKLIGQRIRKARLDSGYTQDTLCKKLDVSIAYLSRIENGSSHINLRRLSQICNLLNVSEGYILNGSSSDSEEYLSKDFSELLRNCSADKQRLIYKIAKIIAESE